MERSTSFTFERGFEIRPCQDGGFVIKQTYNHIKNNENFERAFSTVGEVVDFLIVEKKEFEKPVTDASKGFIEPGVPGA